MIALVEIQDFLKKAGLGEIDSSSLDSLIEEFGEDCKASLRKQLSPRGDYRMRMSGLGRPLCQQKMEKKGNKQEVAYNDMMRFLMGDLVEAVAVFTMKAAGVKVVDTQTPCELELGGEKIRGTLDIILDDGEKKVWDIKSTSPWSFDNKFSGRGGYDVIKEDDPFGYAMQGFLYSESQDLPFGGWIAINKSSGEWDFVEAPADQEEDRKRYIADAHSRVESLLKDDKFKIPFDAVDEAYTVKGEKIYTGNKLMPKTCTFCSFKEKCWKNAEYHDKVTSKAKFPPKAWYTKIVKREL
jgi:hypothetical protein